MSLAMKKTKREKRQSRRAWMVAIAFWGNLVFAVLIYASVALSPKMISYFDLKQQWYENQSKLVTREQQVLYLNRVVTALETDPEFAQELARNDFDRSRPGYEHLPVAPELTLDARSMAAFDVPEEESRPWYYPILKILATKKKVRMILLGFACGLMLFSFVFLHESHIDQLRVMKIQTFRMVHRCMGRYKASS